MSTAGRPAAPRADRRDRWSAYVASLVVMGALVTLGAPSSIGPPSAMPCPA